MARRPSTRRLARTALIVLGMHRSGTSALAGALSRMGADLPHDLMPPADQNAKGFFESSKISHLNEDLLTSAGQSFYSYDSVSADWFESPKAAEFEERAVEAIGEEFGRSHLFVLKDPRICRLLPFWHRVLERAGCRPLHVCTHRHPLDVAASMNRVSAYEADYAVHLWLRHVLEAEAASRGQSRVFTSFDRLMANPVEVVKGIGVGLGLTWPRNPASMAHDLNDFLTEDLRHFRQSGSGGQGQDDLPVWIRDVYAILEEWAAGGERPADHATLDRIGTAVREASSALRPALWGNQDKRWKLDASRTRLADLEHTVSQISKEAASHAANHATEQKMRGAVEIRLAELTRALEAAQAEAAGHQANHATEQQARAEAEAARAAIKARVAELEAELAAAGTDTAERLAELTRALQAAQAEAAGHQANHAAELQARAEAEAARAAIKARVAELEAELAAAGTDTAERLAELTRALQAAQAEAAGHQANHATEQQARAEAEAARAAIKARVAELEAELAAAGTDTAERLAELTRALEAAQAEAAGHQANHAAELQARAEAEAARAAIKARVAELEAELAAAATDMQALRASLAESEQRLSDHHAQAESQARALTDEQDVLRQEKDDLLAALTKLTHQHEQLESQLAQRRAENDQLHQKIDADTTTIATLEAARDELSAHQANLQELLERNSRRMSQMTLQFAHQLERTLDARLQEATALSVEQTRLTAEIQQLTDRHRSEIADLEAKAKAAAEDAETLEKALQDERSAAAATQAEQTRLEAEIQQLTDRHRSEIADLEAKAKAAAEDAETLAKALQDERSALVLSQGNSHRMNNELAALTQSLLDAEDQKEKLFAQLTDEQRRLTESHRSETAELETKAKVAADKAESFEKTLQEERSAAAIKQANNLRMTNELATLTQSFLRTEAQKDKQVNQLTGENLRLNATLEETMTRLAKELAAKKRLETRLAALQDSTSWKLTSPLRRLVMVFKRG